MAKIALVQIKPVLGDKHANIELMEKAIASTDAPVLIFAEMFLTGYTIKDKVLSLAETIDGSSVQKIGQLASRHKRTIIFGMPEKDAGVDGVIYNSAIIVFPDGSASSTRKMYLANFGPFEEETYFAKGDRLTIYDTPVGKVGLIVCFDMFFPELTKYYALAGADMVVCISASPSTTREFFEKVMLARAIENTIFIAYANLVGPEKNLIFWGGDALVGPRGNLLAKAPVLDEGIIEAEVDLKQLEIARQFRPTLKETRDDVLEAALRISKINHE